MKTITAQDSARTGEHDHKRLICRATEADFKPRKLIIPAVTTTRLAAVNHDKQDSSDPNELTS